MTKEVSIEELLYDKDYGEQANVLNKIEVYKNTKYVKTINGIDINTDYENREKFRSEKDYKIKIKITKDGYFEYEAEGCTFDEYLNNEEVGLAIYDKSKKLVVSTFQIFGIKDNLSETFKSNLNISKMAMYCYPDGTYYIYVCERSDKGEIEIKSNAIKLEVQKRKAIDFEVVQNDNSNT